MIVQPNGDTCGDCDYWENLKNSPCTYQDSIRQGVIKKTDPACEDFCPKEKSKGKEKPKLHKASGISEQGYYEAIYYKGKPVFLTVNSAGEFKIYNEVTVESDSFLPKEWPTEIPYKPYGYYEGELSLDEKLYVKVRAEFDLFLDLDLNWKDFLAACVLMSYQQEKLRTVPYVYLVGDNASGKTVALNLFNWLCYRPMLGVTIPPADIYGYLDDADTLGTILEDEAQGLNKDLDKSKIYKTGYKMGACVPRTIMTQNRRFIQYFRTFCFKACAAEEMPRVKGLLERFLFISMTEGYPKKDWADQNEDDDLRFQELRNALLKWRLLTRETKLPEVEFPESVKGRLKELWKPILQVVAGFEVEKNLRVHMEQLQKERLDDRINTIEGRIVKVVCSLYKPNVPLAFNDIWTCLAADLEGKVDDNKPNKMDTSEFGDVTKQNIGSKLRVVLGGEKTKVRLQNVPTCVYVFDDKKLVRVAKKYGCSLCSHVPDVSNSEGVNTCKSENETPLKSFFNEKEPDLKTEKIEEMPESSLTARTSGTQEQHISFEEVSSNGVKIVNPIKPVAQQLPSLSSRFCGKCVKFHTEDCQHPLLAAGGDPKLLKADSAWACDCIGYLESSDSKIDSSFLEEV
jgi:hypothetical protein